MRVLLTTKITYGPIRVYRRCFQFVDIYITVQHGNVRIRAAEMPEEKRNQQYIHGNKVLRNPIEMDLKVNKLVVNEKIL